MKKRIEDIRFSYDNRKPYNSLLYKVQNNPEEKIRLLSTSLRVEKTILPSLYTVLKEIEKKLDLEGVKIEYYISANNEINARCFSLNSGSKLIVILNSGLVNKFSLNELSFVVGHEIGHYLLGHLEYAPKKNEKILTKYNHGMEISADRIGLICTDNIESAIKAMVKLISGLDDRFLSNNLNQFIKQHNKLASIEADIYSDTHPSLPTRTKALKLFSMSEGYYKWKKINEKAPFNRNQTNKIVEKYLDDTSLKFLKGYNNNILEKMKIWTLTAIFMEDNKLSVDEKYILKKEVGAVATSKIIKFVENRDKRAIYKKLEEVKSNYKSLSIEEKKGFVEMINDIFKLYGEKYKNNEILKSILSDK